LHNNGDGCDATVCGQGCRVHWCSYCQTILPYSDYYSNSKHGDGTHYNVFGDSWGMCLTRT
jgi:hypothetical protein